MRQCGSHLAGRLIQVQRNQCRRGVLDMPSCQSNHRLAGGLHAAIFLGKDRGDLKRNSRRVDPTGTDSDSLRLLIRCLDFGDGSRRVGTQARTEVLPAISFTLTTQNHGRQITESEPEEILTETDQGQQRFQGEAAAVGGNQDVLCQEIAALWIFGRRRSSHHSGRHGLSSVAAFF